MYRALSPKGDVFIKLFPSIIGSLCRRKGRKIVRRQRWSIISRKERLPDTTGLILIWTHRHCDSTLSTCTGSWCPILRRGGGHKVPALTKKLFAIDAKGMSLETATLQGRSHSQSWLDHTKQILWCQNMLREWSHVRRILSKYENTPRKQEGSWGLSFFKNSDLSSECVYAFLPGVLERSCVPFKLLTTACWCYSMKCLCASTVKLIFATCSVLWLHAAMRIYEDLTLLCDLFLTLGL